MRGAVVTVLTVLPLLVPTAGAAWLAVNCEDDWCPGGLVEIGAFLMLAAATVVVSQRALVERVGPWRAALAAWSLVLGLASLVFGASQVLERDWMPAMAAAWVGAGLLVGTIVLSRRRPIPPTA